MECIMRDRALFNERLAQGLPASASDSTSNDRQFTVFPALPAELRLKIWQTVIRELQYRIFYVKLRPGREPSVMMTLPLGEDLEDAHGSAADIVNASDDDDVAGDADQIFASGLEAIERRRQVAWSAVFPTILRVNRESRSAYCSVFRIAMPFGTGDDDARKLVVHLSPDRDVLDVGLSTPDPSVSDTENPLLRARLFVSFLCSLRARDPRNVGITRLSLGAQVFTTHTDDASMTVDGLLDQISPSVADESWEGGAADFSQVLENLVSFFRVVNLGHMGRCNPGHPIFSDSKPHFALSIPLAPDRRHYSLRACPACVSHSYLPSTPDVATFTWFDSDPRPHVALDTQQLPSNECPHKAFRAWTELEERFGVKRAGSSFDLYLAAAEGHSHAFDNESARRHLKNEWGSWQQWSDNLQEDYGQWATKMGNLLSQEQQVAVKDEALPAVGFWLWPSEALSSFSAENPCGDHDSGRLIVHDLSGSTPGLLAAHLG
ncbi:hypothetical protein RB595_008006 [Gaeumannomyces hyphopodioides]